MIDFHIICHNDEEKMELGRRLHEALAGSRAYIENEVILNIDQEDSTVLLSIGDNNDNDIEVDVLDHLTCSDKED